MPSDRNVRIVSLVGPHGAGKTALAEALFRLVEPKKAAPDGATSRLDAEPEEVKHKFSLSIHPVTFENEGFTYSVLDTPGIPAFLAEPERALAVSDGVLYVMNAAAGVRKQGERLADLVEASGLPTIGVISQLDHEQADFRKVVAEIESSLKFRPVLVQLPMGQGKSLKGLIDLRTMTAHVYEKAFGKFEETEIPAEWLEEAKQARAALAEIAADGDEELTEHYLENGDLDTTDIEKGILELTRDRKVFPILFAASPSGIGIPETLEKIRRLLPSPAEREFVAKDAVGSEVKRHGLADGPIVARVFRTVIDQFAGRITYARIYSGVLKPDSAVIDARTQHEERLVHLFRTDGAKTTEVPEAGPGEVVVMFKLKEAKTGDTITGKDLPLALPPLPTPNRPSAYAITSANDDKMMVALGKMLEEDPALDVRRSAETGEMLLWGLGNTHLDISCERVKRKHGIEILAAIPTPSYLETITVTAKAQGRFKRQTGGHGQYGDAHVELSPKPRGEGYEFEDAIVGGVIPRNFIPSVDKGIRHALESGPVAGYPVVDLKAKLFFGSYHDVDSSDMAFQVAGSMAFKKAMKEAHPILLEAIMKLEVYLPDEELVGAVMGDLNSRRARVQGMEPLTRGTVIRALCPHAEAMKYDADLRSLTQGAGYFTMELSHFDPVPAPIAEKIIEKRRAEGKVKAIEE